MITIPEPTQYFEGTSVYRNIVDLKFGSDIVSNTLELSNLSGDIIESTIRVFRQGILLTAESQNALNYDYTYVAGINGEIFFYEIIDPVTPITVLYQTNNGLDFINTGAIKYDYLYVPQSPSQIELLFTPNETVSNYIEVYVQGILKREGIDYTFTAPNLIEFGISSLAVPDSFINIISGTNTGTL